MAYKDPMVVRSKMIKWLDRKISLLSANIRTYCKLLRIGTEKRATEGFQCNEQVVKEFRYLFLMDALYTLNIKYSYRRLNLLLSEKY